MKNLEFNELSLDKKGCNFKKNMDNQIINSFSKDNITSMLNKQRNNSFKWFIKFLKTLKINANFKLIKNFLILKLN